MQLMAVKLPYAVLDCHSASSAPIGGVSLGSRADESFS